MIHLIKLYLINLKIKSIIIKQIILYLIILILINLSNNQENKYKINSINLYQKLLVLFNCIKY
jgi:energy-coupling factor transporter transmembrane protein EcfT